jgi:hypothetical protein
MADPLTPEEKANMAAACADTANTDAIRAATARTKICPD